MLGALEARIEAHEHGIHGHPASRTARDRARIVAQKEAIRRFLRTGSLEAALDIGTEAYAREMRYSRPLTLVHFEAPAAPVELPIEGQGG